MIAAGTTILATGGNFTGARSVKNREGARLQVEHEQSEPERPSTPELPGSEDFSAQHPLDTVTGWHSFDAIMHSASEGLYPPEHAVMHASTLADATADTVNAASMKHAAFFRYGECIVCGSPYP